MKKIRKKYLEFSEVDNALDYLERAHYYLDRVKTKVEAWKWVVITLHGTLYGFAICALKGTNPDRVAITTKRGIKRLINFDEALKRCQDPNRMNQLVYSRTLQLTDQQRKSIRHLRETFRNNFEHYIPMSWYIEIHGMPQMAIDVLEVVHFLALECGNVLLTQNQKRKIKSLIFQSIRLLKQSKLYEESCLAKRMSGDKELTKKGT